MPCAARIQGALAKLADPAAARAEMASLGLRSPAPFVAGVAAFELAASAAVITGGYRARSALAPGLITPVANAQALRFRTPPRGQARAATTIGFFEHLGLARAFAIVALHSQEAAP